MNSILNLTTRPSRFLKPGRSLLLLMLFVFSTAAFATPTTPTSDFIDNGDGTVTHKLTGLVWMRCSMGQTWDKATTSCTGTAATYTWDAAMALKSNFAGKSDWRLPNIAELHTIVERENYNPAINTTIFPNSPDYSWSSSPNAYDNNLAWFIYFNSGYDGSAAGSSYNFAVRLVRGGQSFASLPLTTPDGDFIDNKDGTITHKRTGLMWQRCSIGQTWSGSTCSGTANTYTYNQAIALMNSFASRNDWRLPNENELLSIVESGSSNNPAINKTQFPNTPNSKFWSSSMVANNSNNSWVVNFYNSDDDYADNNNGYAVRLVRGQWANAVTNSPLDKQASANLMKGKTIGQCLFGGYCRGKATEAHSGIDYVIPATTPVYSVCDGIVRIARNATTTPNIWNRFTIIQCTDANKLFVYYGHINATVSAAKGKNSVKAGQQIGTVADWKANSHLHLGFNTKYLTTQWGYVDVAESTTADCNQDAVSRRRDLLTVKGWKDPAIVGTELGWLPFTLKGGAATGNCNAPAQTYIPAPTGKSLPYYPWK
jgi:Protein of unknown function (DUF1566)/Peptidase family M23